MTVQTTFNSNSFVGDGIATIFGFTFQTIEASWVFSTVDDITTSISVSLNEDQEINPGGACSFDAPPASGAIIVIFRITPQTQLLDYQPYGAFPAEASEDALDKLTMVVQDNGSPTGGSTFMPVAGGTWLLNAVQFFTAIPGPTIGTGGMKASFTNVFGYGSFLMEPDGTGDGLAAYVFDTGDSLVTGTSLTGWQIADQVFGFGNSIVTETFLASQGYVPEAPIDGAPYARQDAGWVATASGGGAVWGTITGTLSDQADLQSELDLKAPLAATNAWTGGNDFGGDGVLISGNSLGVALNATGGQIVGQLNAGGNRLWNVDDGTDPQDGVNVTQLNNVVAQVNAVDAKIPEGWQIPIAAGASNTDGTISGTLRNCSVTPGALGVMVVNLTQPLTSTANAGVSFSNFVAFEGATLVWVADSTTAISIISVDKTGASLAANIDFRVYDRGLN